MTDSRVRHYVEENDGDSDCEPPEPGKKWLAIVDQDGEEVAIVVHRGGEIPPEKRAIAQRIADLFTQEARWR